jgi:TFIIF-interacting CTD phosphatase-like protein
MGGSSDTDDNSPRKLLILDLDETLIYATETPLAERDADFRVGRYHVYRRPHLTSFLDASLTRFEVAVWTASSPNYAAGVIANIFPDPAQLAFAWAADRCSTRYCPDDGSYYTRKPLLKVRRRLGYAREQVIAVDDTPRKWEQSYGNLVPVRPYEGDPNDEELRLLTVYLDHLRHIPNVRAIEKRRWRTEAASLLPADPGTIQ